MINVKNAAAYGINPGQFENIAEPRLMQNWVPISLTSNHRGMYALVAGNEIVAISDNRSNAERLWHALTPDGREKLSYERSDVNVWLG